MGNGSGDNWRVCANGLQGRSCSADWTGDSTVADTVYLADGSPAQGNLVITWPAFLTASGTAIAGGTKNVALGTSGALSVALAPNAGANPAGVYYTVVYQLGPGEIRSEYWVVPTTSRVRLRY